MPSPLFKIPAKDFTSCRAYLASDCESGYKRTTLSNEKSMSGPNYHFLYIDQTLDADWLFVAARRYWDHFRPMVIADLDLVAFVPAGRSIAITTLARRDMAPGVAALVKKRYAGVHHDPLVYDFVEEMKLTLDGRTDLDQRFGIPEATPMPPRKSS
jgi:hypothetical protein